MTDTSNMPDDQRQRIIEAATLMLKQQHLDQGEECDRVGRALYAALAPPLGGEGIDALMMVQYLLDGKPYSMKSDNSDSIQLRIDLAHAIGATVEADALPSGLRSIGINPPSRGCPCRSSFLGRTPASAELDIDPGGQSIGQAAQFCFA
jgi:hypothetical protein